MKNLKTILMASFLTIGAFSTITFTSCNGDKCKNTVCSNGGTCKEADGSCSCAAGFEGTDCSTQSLTKILNTGNASVIYSFVDNSGGTCGNYTGTFTASRSGADTTKLILTNFGGFGATTSVTAKVDQNTLTIPLQTITNAATNTVSGSGTYSNGIITGSYTNNDGVTSCTYNFTWNKQ